MVHQARAIQDFKRYNRLFDCGLLAAHSQGPAQGALTVIAAEVGAIPDLLTTNKDTTHHAVGSIYQLMAIEYVAVLILHAGFTVVARELLWV